MRLPKINVLDLTNRVEASAAIRLQGQVYQIDASIRLSYFQEVNVALKKGLVEQIRSYLTKLIEVDSNPSALDLVDVDPYIREVATRALQKDVAITRKVINIKL